MSLRPSFASLLCTVVLGSGLVAGCQKDPPKPTTWDKGSGALPATPPAAVPTPPGAMPASPHGTMPASPHGADMTVTPPGALVGAVAETMRSGGYTYARVVVGGQDFWAAGPETTLAVGAQVDLTGGTVMIDFRSNTLDRTFDRIYFLAAWSGGAPAAGAGMAAASPHGTTAAPPAPALAPGETIAPVAGGQTIAQVYAGKAGLAGKPIAIHGKVVKFNGGIMGKNWLHLQDGSGAAGTNDLIVTTQATAAVGDVIVARGTIALDKDLGAGYRYDVLLEDATVEK